MEFKISTLHNSDKAGSTLRCRNSEIERQRLCRKLERKIIRNILGLKFQEDWITLILNRSIRKDQEVPIGKKAKPNIHKGLFDLIRSNENYAKEEDTAINW